MYRRSEYKDKKLVPGPMYQLPAPVMNGRACPSAARQPPETHSK